MRIAIVSAALLCWIGSAGAQPAPVAARMRNVRLHLTDTVELHVDDLRGHLTSRTSGAPFFDDINSYRVDIDYARVDMSPQSLSNLMNGYVFAGDRAPVKNVSISIEGGELLQSGTLKKGIPVPFKMRGTIAATEDGRLRIHPTSLKAAGFVSKRVLDFFGLELERLLDVRNTRGVAVDGDDLLLDPGEILPPPRVHGRVTRAWIDGGAVRLQFGDAAAPGIDPPLPKVKNYMYYRGGTLRFGKLTMEDADLLLTDADPSDPFDFSPPKYEAQLVAGYSKNTKAHGLIVYMPDADDLVKRGRRTPS